MQKGTKLKDKLSNRKSPDGKLGAKNISTSSSLDGLVSIEPEMGSGREEPTLRLRRSHRIWGAMSMTTRTGQVSMYVATSLYLFSMTSGPSPRSSGDIQQSTRYTMAGIVGCELKHPCYFLPNSLNPEADEETFLASVCVGWGRLDAPFGRNWRNLGRIPS